MTTFNKCCFLSNWQHLISVAISCNNTQPLPNKWGWIIASKGAYSSQNVFDIPRHILRECYIPIFGSDFKKIFLGMWTFSGMFLVHYSSKIFLWGKVGILYAHDMRMFIIWINYFAYPFINIFEINPPPTTIHRQPPLLTIIYHHSLLLTTMNYC